jgi:hypothetical protein
MSHDPGPSALNRLASEDPSGLRRRLTALLQASPGPTVCLPGPDGTDAMLSGSAMLQLGLERARALAAAGMRRGDVLASPPRGAARVIDLVAALLGEFTYWPVEDASPWLDGETVADPAAPLVWRPVVVRDAARATDEAAVVPYRLPRAILDALAPAGPHVRLLVQVTPGATPFAVNAQTVARLGSTLRRGLGLPRQSLRLCATPAESGAALLLDLLPGLAARQVLVLAPDGGWSATGLVDALARYRPHSVTLTVAQARALLATPITTDAVRALAATRVLLADVSPVPQPVRRTFMLCTARLDVGYVLAECGDAILVRDGRPRGR